MIHKKLLHQFGGINEEIFDLSTRYLLEVTNSSKYLAKLRDWFKVQWPNSHSLFNEKGTYDLDDLSRILPTPQKADPSLLSALQFKISELRHPGAVQGFGKLCLVRIFYFGLSEICKEKVPSTWKDYTSHFDGEEAPSYPLDKLPFLNYEYDPVTIDAAQQLLAEWTSDHNYYASVSNWFGRGKHEKLLMRERGNLPIDFPYTFDDSYSKLRITTPKRDWDHFTDLCRQMAFNWYAEEFLGLLLPFDHNIKRKHGPKEHAHELALMIGVDMATYPDESVIAQINQHFENANIHFRKVENDMNTLDAYKHVPSVQVQLIHGKPADKYTEAELMALIRDARKAQDDIRDLVNTSTRVKAKHEALEANIAVYVAALDALAE